jgi:hypothetical protein
MDRQVWTGYVQKTGGCAIAEEGGGLVGEGC